MTVSKIVLMHWLHHTNQGRLSNKVLDLTLSLYIVVSTNDKEVFLKSPKYARLIIITIITKDKQIILVDSRNLTPLGNAKPIKSTL